VTDSGEELEVGLPLEAFVERIVALARERCPEATIDFVPGDVYALHAAWPDGYQQHAHLDNLWRAYRRADGRSVAPAVRSYLRIFSRTAPAPAELGVERLVATVRSVGLVRAFRRRTGEEEPTPETTPAWFPLVADIAVILAFDLDDRIQMATEADLQRLELERGEALDRAARNVLEPLEVERHGEGPLYLLTAGGNYESSLLLHPNLWRALGEDLEGEALVSVPCRDLIYFSDGGAEEGEEELRRWTRKAFRQGSYPVSEALLRFTDGGWEPLDEA
jgi:hypothetical protein